MTDDQINTLNEFNTSLAHTVSTIHMDDTSFPSIDGGDLNKKRRKDKDERNEASELDQSKTKSKSRSNILHTHPIHQKSISENSRNLIRKLKEIYKNDVLPIEQKFNLYNFCLPTNEAIQDAEFDAKPMVLLLGQYSTGKTTFIRHLIGRDFPGMHIGPEPTTDRFTALIHGSDESNLVEGSDDTSDEECMDSTYDSIELKWKNQSTGRTMKGNSLTVVPELPFSTLSSFGSGFLSHFNGSICDAPLLEHVTLIDTPGVLSGEKQRLSRSYDFAKVTKWFADRSDLILLLFDGHKLDISDELKDVIQTIRPNNDDKMRCILNKADSVTREQLVRVYGSLMWSMGKIFQSPEVVRVYTGSYWERPLYHDDFKKMFGSDEFLLINELVNLPKSCAERKVNEVVKRIRIIKVHVCLLGYLKHKTPKWVGKKKAMETLINNLDDVFDDVRIKYQLSAGDFPVVDEFRKSLEEIEDFSKLPFADKQTLRKLDDIIKINIPALMSGVTGLNAPPRTPKAGNTMTEEKPEINSLTKNDTENDCEVGKNVSLRQFVAFHQITIISILIVLYILLFVLVTQNEFKVLPVWLIRHFHVVEKFSNDFLNDFVLSDKSLTQEQSIYDDLARDDL